MRDSPDMCDDPGHETWPDSRQGQEMAPACAMWPDPGARHGPGARARDGPERVWWSTVVRCV